ncbi:MAG: hypothetical protein LBQ22_06255 [Bacteroidales bacterium]|nr:hypothetical protein [Bacteroidales bacterium]
MKNNKIDFAARRDRETIYVQVRYFLKEETIIERKFGNFEKIKDNYPKMVISMDEFNYNSKNEIQQIYLKDFLSVE